MTVDERLSELGLVLPKPPAPGGNYEPFRRDGDVIYLSGQGPLQPNGSFAVGKVGHDVSIEVAREHARQAGLGLLAVAREAAGTLEKVKILKVFGMVNAAADFTEHPFVINGCSDFFVAVLGDRGHHARSAIGMGSLPKGMTVEIEAVVRIV